MTDIHDTGETAGWRCYAHPVHLNGKECGRVNRVRLRDGKGLVYCEQCGCTKIASDLRRAKRQIGQQALPLAVVLLSVLGGGCASLTPEQRDLEVAYQAVHLVDGMQTTEVAMSRDKYHDGLREIGMAGAFLGHHPTEADTITWYAADAALHVGVTYALREHPLCERVWQGVSLGLSAGTVAHNFSVGIGFGWPVDARRAR